MTMVWFLFFSVGFLILFNNVFCISFCTRIISPSQQRAWPLNGAVQLII